MASSSHHDEDTLPEETAGYKLSQPKQSIAEYQQMGMSPPSIISHVDWPSTTASAVLGLHICHDGDNG